MNRSLNSLESSPKIFDLLRELRKSNDTPSLITWITEDADRMHLAGILSKVSKTGNPASYQWLVAACGKVGYSFEVMQNRIRPVARALGLYNIQTDKNYYQLLGIRQNATENEIRTAFRAIARRIHPDTRGDHKMDEDAFVALNTAYKTLSNPLLRRKYDQNIHSDGIWSEGPKYQNRQRKKKPKSKIKLIFLFGMIFVILVGIILFSDILFKMSVMENIDEELLVQKQRLNDYSEKVETSTGSNANVESDPPLDQQLSNNNEELEERVPKKSALKNVKKKYLEQAAKQGLEASNDKKPYRAILDTTADAAKETPISSAETEQGELDSTADSNEIQMAQGKNEQAAENLETKIDGEPDTWTKRSKEALKPLVSGGPVDKRRLERLHSEVRAVDLIKNPPTRGSLQLFLDRYTSVYQARDEDQFVNFFTPDAKENDQPIKRLFPIYRQTFREFEKIEYHIRLKEYQVDLNTAVIKVKGEFSLDWNSRQDGKRRSSKGKLSMGLVADGEGGFKIKAINY